MELQGAERSGWVDGFMDRLIDGEVDDLLAELAHHSGPGRKRAVQLHKHLERFRDALDYDAAGDMGFPLGSGEVQSAHRYIPQKRLKLPGAWWRPESVNRMLALRVLRANGWWHDFWADRQEARRAA